MIRVLASMTRIVAQQCVPAFLSTPLVAHLLSHLPLGQVDIILLMSVNPGFGGQKFIPATLDKLAEARAMIDESGFDISLEIDGGVGPANIADVAKAGADNFVAGSAIFNTPDYKATIDAMRAELAKVPVPGKDFNLY